MTRGETWSPVRGFEGYYEVSTTGRVKSLERTVRGPRGEATIREKILKGNLNIRGYQVVTLSREGQSKNLRVHRLVAEAFIPNPKRYPLVRHLNDKPEDNRVENLAWGTVADNAGDAVMNGVHPESRKTHCPSGHEYNTENTKMVGRNRQCRTCQREFLRKLRKEGIPEGDSRHGTRTGYNSYRCKCELCIDAKNTGGELRVEKVG